MINKIKGVLLSTATASLLIFSSNVALGQNDKNSTNPCGFVETQEFMDRIDLLKAHVSEKTTAANDTIPLGVHLVANDFGYGRHSIPKLLENICQLNEQYIPVNMHFWIQWPIDYIDNSTYFAHTFQDGYKMMSNNNIAGVLNLYWVGDPAGNCGYYTHGNDAIALKNSCTNGSNTTIAHELGHLFNLPHTFRGWEGGNTPSNPEKVTRGTGANCNYAGDKFCDTDADFISYRWGCPYNIVKTDANGDLYHPDSSYYMSYSSDACQSRFSPQQIQTVRADRDTRWSSLNQNYPNHVANFANPQITSFTDTLYEDRRLEWSPVPGADAYYVQMSLKLLSHVYRFDTLVYNTTSIVIPEKYMSNGKDYLFRIKPLNGNTLCSDFSPDHEAYYNKIPNPNVSPDAISSEALENVSVAARHQDGQLKITLDAPINLAPKIYITDLLGRSIYDTENQFYHGRDNLDIELNLQAGLYLLSLDIEGHLKTVKFSVH